jgi:protein-S-isoprenylcysteine O-methyltransferase Ste14
MSAAIADGTVAGAGSPIASVGPAIAPAPGGPAIAFAPGESTRLPALGRRGEGWVALQLILVAAAALAGMFGPAWPAGVKRRLAIPGTLAAGGGAYLLAGGIADLGRQLTPFPRPVAGGQLQRAGVYRLVRHPMYGGVLLLVLGWSLFTSPLTMLPLGVSAAFLDAKRRREEAWLLEQHPEYAEYCDTVRRRFVPFLW